MEKDINQTLKKAITAHKEGKLQEAEQLYQESLKIDPKNIDANHNFGVLKVSMNQSAAAIPFFKTAIEVNPNIVQFWISYTGALINEKKFEEAELSCRKIIELKPDYAEAYYDLGFILANSQKLYESEISYKKSIELKPTLSYAYLELSRISFSLKKLEDGYNLYIKFLRLESKDVISNAKLENVITKFAKKIQKQKGIPSFFDNFVEKHIINKTSPTYDFCEIFENGQQSKENRLIDYNKRTPFLFNDKPPTAIPFSSTQGVHSLIKWKEIPLYKSAFDLVIYSMLLQEVKPNIIIELGSGEGGSALWFADTAASLGLDTHVYSFDINKPLITHEKVTFIEYDLNEINNLNKLSYWKNFVEKKIIIEDAHVNLKDILHFFDSILKKDDYLLIEDSSNKHEIITDFINKNESKYKLDQYYLDFFGKNITSCENSIFKVL